MWKQPDFQFLPCLMQWRGPREVTDHPSPVRIKGNGSVWSWQDWLCRSDGKQGGRSISASVPMEHQRANNMGLRSVVELLACNMTAEWPKQNRFLCPWPRLISNVACCGWSHSTLPILSLDIWDIMSPKDSCHYPWLLSWG